MKFLMCILLMLSFSAHAVTYVGDKQIAPYAGYLFSPDEERQVRQNNEERLTLKDLSYHQEQKAQILEERVKGYKEYVDEQNRMGNWSKFGWIAAGSVGTVLVLFLATSVVKSAGK